MALTKEIQVSRFSEIEAYYFEPELTDLEIEELEAAAVSRVSGGRNRLLDTNVFIFPSLFIITFMLIFARK